MSKETGTSTLTLLFITCHCSFSSTIAVIGRSGFIIPSAAVKESGSGLNTLGNFGLWTLYITNFSLFKSPVYTALFVNLLLRCFTYRQVTYCNTFSAAAELSYSSATRFSFSQAAPEAFWSSTSCYLEGKPSLIWHYLKYVLSRTEYYVLWNYLVEQSDSRDLRQHNAHLLNLLHGTPR